MATRRGKEIHRAGEFVVVELFRFGPDDNETVAYEVVIPDADFHVIYASLKDAMYVIDRLVAETAINRARRARVTGTKKACAEGASP